VTVPADGAVVRLCECLAAAELVLETAA